MSNAINLYFILFITGYFATYPIRVLATNNDLSILPITLIPGALLLGFVALTKLKHIRINGQGLLILGLLAIIVLFYSVNVSTFSASPSLKGLYDKHLVFFIAVAPLLLFYRHITLKSGNIWLSTLLLGLALLQVVGAILNSVFIQLPIAPEELLDKYYVGFLLRAGAGYLDPNFLALNFLLLLFLARAVVSSNVVKTIIQFSLFSAIILTFSRSAWVMLLLFSTVATFKESRINAGLFAIFLLGILVLLIANSDLAVMFRRFTDDEGTGSLNDRIDQYTIALDLFNRKYGFDTILLGFGGPDWFKFSYGRHLHNFYMGMVVDAGFISLGALLLLIGYFLTIVKNEWRLMGVIWVVSVIVLPSVPDTLYLTLVLGIVGQQNFKSKWDSTKPAPNDVKYAEARESRVTPKLIT